MSTQVRERLRVDLKSFTAPSMVHTLRPAEMIAAGIGLGLIVLVILYYFLSLAPVDERLKSVEKDAAEQSNIIKPTSTPASKTGPSQKEQIQEAKNSLSEFEGSSLKPMEQGRIDLINEINQLAKADKLRLGSGIEMHATYRAAGLSDSEAQGSKKKKDSDSLDVFPRVQFHFVVRGEYPDLRKFLRDLESSKQYVVVDSVNLSNSEQKQGRGSKAAAQMAPVSGLSLTVAMDSYFRP
jgi:hypothetical protein